MYVFGNLTVAAAFAVASCVLLLFSGRGRGLKCALAASYCGVIVLTFTRGSMGSFVLVQAVLILFAPLLLIRRPLPPFGSRGVVSWTCALLAIYVLAIGIGGARYDPSLVYSMSGRFQTVGGVPLPFLMAAYRLLVVATLALAFLLPLRYVVDRRTLAGCLTVCWFFTCVLAAATAIDYAGLLDLKFDVSSGILDVAYDSLHDVVLGFRRASHGLMLVLGVFLSYALTQVTTSRALATAILVSVPLQIAAVLLSYSRAALVALVVAFACLIVLQVGVRAVRAVLVASLALFIGIAVLSASPAVSQRMILRPGLADESVIARKDTWIAILRHLADDPGTLITGVGLQNFQYTLTVGNRIAPLVTAHNNYLHVLAETGLIGLAIFGAWAISILVWLWRWKARALSPEGRTLPGIFLACMLGLLASAVTQESLAPASSMLAWLLHFHLVLGLWIAWYRTECLYSAVHGLAGHSAQASRSLTSGRHVATLSVAATPGITSRATHEIG